MPWLVYACLRYKLNFRGIKVPNHEGIKYDLLSDFEGIIFYV